MGKLKKSFLFGIADGFINSFLLFFCGELCVSILLDGSAVSCMIASYICAAISLILFYIVINKLDYGIMGFYVIRLIFFLLIALLLFIIEVETHISILPRRPLANADGLVILTCQISYLIISEILRFIGCLSVAFSLLIKKKTKTEYNQRSLDE